MQKDLLQLFPAEKRLFWRSAVEERGLQEIRIRAMRPVLLIAEGRELFLDQGGHVTAEDAGAYCAEKEEIEQLLKHICHYSLYAYEEELRQGFLTVNGGHRVGIAGQVVAEGDGSIRTIKNISYVNIRIAHEVKGAADKVLSHMYEKGQPKNVLIISPPGCGKTTLLRDLIRQVSDGNAYGTGRCVGVVDERSEIAGSCRGQAQNDIGMRTDVLDSCAKRQGMMLLLRAMSPQVIAIDELGGEEDMAALQTVSYCGVKILATAHGDNPGDVLERFGGACADIIFDLFLILGKENGKPSVRQILRKEEVYASFVGRHNDHNRMHGSWPVVPAAVCSSPETCQTFGGDS